MHEEAQRHEHPEAGQHDRRTPQGAAQHEERQDGVADDLVRDGPERGVDDVGRVVREHPGQGIGDQPQDVGEVAIGRGVGGIGRQGQRGEQRSEDQGREHDLDGQRREQAQPAVDQELRERQALGAARHQEAAQAEERGDDPVAAEFEKAAARGEVAVDDGAPVPDHDEDREHHPQEIEPRRDPAVAVEDGSDADHLRQAPTSRRIGTIIVGGGRAIGRWTGEDYRLDIARSSQGRCGA